VTKRTIKKEAETLELYWPGKYDDDGQRVALSACKEALQVHERFCPPPQSSALQGRIIRGDNLRILASLAEHEGSRDKIDLAYIDPPFNTGNRFSVRRSRGETDGTLELPAYHDAWKGGAAGFLTMLDARLRWIYERLADHGSLYVHVDPTMGHAVKLMLDELFGPQCFQREIVWRIGWLSGFKTTAKNWIRNHDLIFFYVKDPNHFTFNKLYVPYPAGYLRRDGKAPTGKGFPLDDVWNANEGELALSGRESLDSIQIKSFSREKTGWATQKNESLLRRIILASSQPGDLVADVFCGSGTTAVAAQELGRRWMICDESPVAVQISRARMLDMQASFTVESLEDRLPCNELIFRARLESGQGEIRVKIGGMRWSASVRKTLSGSLQELSKQQLVEAWTVTDDAEPERVLFEEHRGHRDRSLSLDSSVLPLKKGCKALRVTVWDIRGEASERVLSLV